MRANLEKVDLSSGKDAKLTFTTSDPEFLRLSVNEVKLMQGGPLDLFFHLRLTADPEQFRIPDVDEQQRDFHEPDSTCEFEEFTPPPVQTDVIDDDDAFAATDEGEAALEEPELENPVDAVGEEFAADLISQANAENELHAALTQHPEAEQRWGLARAEGLDDEGIEAMIAYLTDINSLPAPFVTTDSDVVVYADNLAQTVRDMFGIPEPQAVEQIDETSSTLVPIRDLVRVGDWMVPKIRPEKNEPLGASFKPKLEAAKRQVAEVQIIGSATDYVRFTNGEHRMLPELEEGWRFYLTPEMLAVGDQLVNMDYPNRKSEYVRKITETEIRFNVDLNGSGTTDSHPGIHKLPEYWMHWTYRTPVSGHPAAEPPVAADAASEGSDGSQAVPGETAPEIANTEPATERTLIDLMRDAEVGEPLFFRHERATQVYEFLRVETKSVQARNIDTGSETTFPISMLDKYVICDAPESAVAAGTIRGGELVPDSKRMGWGVEVEK